MKKLLAAAAFLTLPFISSMARAADGSSGCGPAWYVFKENSILSSSLRATTNGILWPTTTIGMTLGTSNCAKHSLVIKEKAAIHFATIAYNDLQIQLSQGSGDHLGAFATTLGCSWQYQQEFNAALQKNYGNIFPTETTEALDVVDHTIQVLRANPSLAAACQAGVG